MRLSVWEKEQVTKVSPKLWESLRTGTVAKAIQELEGYIKDADKHAIDCQPARRLYDALKSYGRTHHTSIAERMTDDRLHIDTYISWLKSDKGAITTKPVDKSSEVNTLEPKKVIVPVPNKENAKSNEVNKATNNSGR